MQLILERPVIFGPVHRAINKSCSLDGHDNSQDEVNADLVQYTARRCANINCSEKGYIPFLVFAWGKILAKISRVLMIVLSSRGCTISDNALAGEAIDLWKAGTIFLVALKKSLKVTSIEFTSRSSFLLLL